MRTYRMLSLSEALPGVLNGGKTYAACPLWSGSFREEVRFAPLPKKKALKLVLGNSASSIGYGDAARTRTGRTLHHAPANQRLRHLPVSQWRGYDEPTTPEPPHPSTWGACPPPFIEQAITQQQDGGSAPALIDLLESDPTDPLAIALARLGRALHRPKH